MRKTFKTVLLSLMTMFATASYAQVDGTFVFVDKDGKEIPDGSTYTASEVEIIEEGTEEEYVLVNSGVYVKNTKAENQGIGATVTLSRIDNGGVFVCFPSQCTPTMTSPMTNVLAGGRIEANEVKSIAAEWLPTADGEAEMTMKLQYYDIEIVEVFGIKQENYVLNSSIECPSITIKFVKNATGINDVLTIDNTQVVGRYAADGTRLTAPCKGLNILKLSDGRTVKVMHK